MGSGSMGRSGVECMRTVIVGREVSGTSQPKGNSVRARTVFATICLGVPNDISGSENDVC